MHVSLALAVLALAAGQPATPPQTLDSATAAAHTAIPAAPSGLVWWPADRRPEFADYDARARALTDRQNLRRMHDLLASEPHIAGTPADLRTVERIENELRQAGVDSIERHEFWAYLSRHITSEVEIITPERKTLPLKEPPIPGDASTAHPDLPMGFNAYSGSGDVTAQVVYANYGTKADFAKLKELGIDVTGKIVIARYGGNFRGFKAKFAQAAGAAGLIIFSDPRDDGFHRGIPYGDNRGQGEDTRGGWYTEHSIQRGSLLTLDQPGDALTPGIEATQNAHRLDPADVALPKIPVQPMGWGAAQEILSRMTGPGVSARGLGAWQGGIPVAYRLTGGEGLTVRLKVHAQRELTKTYNVVGTIRGSTHPDQLVIVGCHHDAWNFGASDPLSGMIALLQSARSIGELARQGRRPARSIAFAAWGAEEHGIIGSTEWVEGRRAQLVQNAVAYINLDMAAQGPDFGSAATPSLRRVIADAARAVPAARQPGVSVMDAWLKKSGAAAPPFGDIGGGSDHIAFVCHAAVPVASLGGGGSHGACWHASHDTLEWYRSIVGEDYEPARMVADMSTATLLRLADAPLVPLDPSLYGSETLRHLAAITTRGRELNVFAAGARQIAPELARVEGAAIAFDHAARRVYSRLIEAVGSGQLDAATLESINTQLMLAERAWLDDDGIPGRPWFKNLFVSSDQDSGYASWMLPGLRAAVERKDAAALDQLARRYVAVFDRLSECLRQIEAQVR